MHMHDVIVAMIMWKETRERSPSLGTRVLPRTYIWNVRETCYDATHVKPYATHVRSLRIMAKEDIAS